MNKFFVDAVKSIAKPLPPYSEVIGVFSGIGVLSALGRTNLFGPNTPGYYVNMETWTLQWALVAFPIWFIVAGAIRVAATRNASTQVAARNAWMGKPRLAVGCLWLAIGAGYFTMH